MLASFRKYSKRSLIAVLTSGTHKEAGAKYEVRHQSSVDFSYGTPLRPFCEPLYDHFPRSPAALRSCKERIEVVAAALGLEGFARIDAFVHADTGEVRMPQFRCFPVCIDRSRYFLFCAFSKGTMLLKRALCACVY